MSYQSNKDLGIWRRRHYDGSYRRPGHVVDTTYTHTQDFDIWYFSSWDFGTFTCTASTPGGDGLYNTTDCRTPGTPPNAYINMIDRITDLPSWWFESDHEELGWGTIDTDGVTRFKIKLDVNYPSTRAANIGCGTDWGVFPVVLARCGPTTNTHSAIVTANADCQWLSPVSNNLFSQPWTTTYATWGEATGWYDPAVVTGFPEAILAKPDGTVDQWLRSELEELIFTLALTGQSTSSSGWRYTMQIIGYQDVHNFIYD